MKISPLTLLLVGAVVGALAWGTCNAGKATDAQIRLEEALQAHRDSATQWQEARQVLTARLGALQRDSSTLARQYVVASHSAAVARHRGDSLLLLIPDTLRVAIRLTFDSLAGEAIACRGLLVNCELRAQNAEARAHGDSIHFADLQRFVSDTLEPAWHTAERKARPSWLRDLWRSRSVTLPLAAVTTFLLLTHR